MQNDHTTDNIPSFLRKHQSTAQIDKKTRQKKIDFNETQKKQ